MAGGGRKGTVIVPNNKRYGQSSAGLRIHKACNSFVNPPTPPYIPHIPRTISAVIESSSRPPPHPNSSPPHPSCLRKRFDGMFVAGRFYCSALVDACVLHRRQRRDGEGNLPRPLAPRQRRRKIYPGQQLSSHLFKQPCYVGPGAITRGTAHAGQPGQVRMSARACTPPHAVLLRFDYLGGKSPGGRGGGLAFVPWFEEGWHPSFRIVDTRVITVVETRCRVLLSVIDQRWEEMGKTRGKEGMPSCRPPPVKLIIFLFQV